MRKKGKTYHKHRTMAHFGVGHKSIKDTREQTFSDRRTWGNMQSGLTATSMVQNINVSKYSLSGVVYLLFTDHNAADFDENNMEVFI